MEENEYIHIDKGEEKLGILRIFFGFAAGVGKTYAMLAEAHELQEIGKNIVIGYIEPHDRPETNRLIAGLPNIPTKKIHYKTLELNEPDVDQIIKQKPDIVLIDELAHTNAYGSRNKKRYQDVEEILKAGIDVFTTMNVQHIESLHDIVAQVTGIDVQETVPDTCLQQALIKVVDVEPEELINRLEQGKIYADHAIKQALANFFIPEKLEKLRGLAIQRASDHINRINSKTLGIQSNLLTIVYDDLPKMSEKCIRWTARLAQGFHAEWTVITIKTQEEIEPSSTLAEKLGAKVIVVEEENSFETIIEFSKMTGVTDIIMGKNIKQHWYENVFAESFENRLLKRLHDTELHLIPFHESKKVWRFNYQEMLTDSWRNASIAVGGMICATLITEVMKFLHVGDQNLMLVYILFVLLIARATSGYVWSAISSIISVLAFNWFFVEPLYSLTVYKQGYPITLLIMFAVALMVSNLMVRLKKQAQTAIAKEKQMEILYELSKKFILTENRAQILAISTTYLSRLLDREIAIFDAKGQVEHVHCVAEQTSVLSEKAEVAVAYWTAKNQKEAGHKTDTLIGAKGYYLPILTRGNTLAVLGIKTIDEPPLTNDQFNYIKLVLAQIAIVLEQNELKQEKNAIQIENAQEKVRSNLLRSVSHDLRTPLTVISGIAQMLEQDNKLNSEMQKRFLQDIQVEAQWLIRMVENLLSITRIDSATMDVEKTAEPVEEIMEAVYQHIKKVYPKAQLNIDLPEEMLFVQVDPILIEQALFNLVENALRHGQPQEPIRISIYQDLDQTVFEIENKGEVPFKQFQKLQANLTQTYEVPVDSKNGLGIGLSIVKTIVHAHHGHINMTVKNGKTCVQIFLK